MIPWTVYEFVVVVVGILYPCYQSQLVLENRDASSADYRQWLTYWTVFGFLLFLDVYFLSSLYAMWWFVDARTFLVVWLVRSRGAEQLYDMGLSRYIKAAGLNATVFIQGQYEVLRKTVPIDRYLGYADRFFPAFFKRLLGMKVSSPSAVDDITTAVRDHQAKMATDADAAARAMEAAEKATVESQLSTMGGTTSVSAVAAGEGVVSRGTRAAARRKAEREKNKLSNGGGGGGSDGVGTGVSPALAIQEALASAHVDSESDGEDGA